MKASSSFWKPVKKIKPYSGSLKLSNYSKRNPKEWRLIDKNPYGDTDHDKVINYFDCKPLNKKQQGWAHRGIKMNRERSTYIKMMSPDKFLRTTYVDAFDASRYIPLFPYETYEQQIINRKKVAKYKKIIASKNKKMDIPFLLYDKAGAPTGYEGRHRAVAARELGIKLMPVTIARTLKQPRDWHHMRETHKQKRTKKDWRNDLDNVDEDVSSKSADISIKEQRRYGEERPEAIKELTRKINKMKKGYKGTYLLPESVSHREFMKGREGFYKDFPELKEKDKLIRRMQKENPNLKITPDPAGQALEARMIFGAEIRVDPAGNIVGISSDEDDNSMEGRMRIRDMIIAQNKKMKEERARDIKERKAMEEENRKIQKVKSLSDIEAIHENIKSEEKMREKKFKQEIKPEREMREKEDNEEAIDAWKSLDEPKKVAVIKEAMKETPFVTKQQEDIAVKEVLKSLNKQAR